MKHSIEYQGEVYKNKITLWRKKADRTITYEAFTSRLRKHGDIEKALREPVIHPVVKDHLGKEYKYFIEMAKAYGLSFTALSKRLNKYDLKTALTLPKRQKRIKDHLGNVYSSYKEMAEFYGLKKNTLFTRLRRTDLKTALTTPVMDRRLRHNIFKQNGN